MHTLTVEDILGDPLPESGLEKYRIYIFRDEDFVLYVGKTDQYIVDRLQEHLGLTYRDESIVGRLVEDNTPLSHSWIIDLFTLEDCVPFVRRHYPNARGIDVGLAESAMILEHSPTLNQQLNPHPRDLPSKYTAKRDARMLNAFKKAFNDRP